VKKTNCGIIVIVIYVDDLIITRDNDVDISDLKKFLNKKFEMKDLGKFYYFFSAEIMKLHGKSMNAETMKLHRKNMSAKTMKLHRKSRSAESMKLHEKNMSAKSIRLHGKSM